MRKWLQVLFLLAIPFSGISGGFAQTETEKMVYLAFEWVDGQPSLKGFEIVPGKLKRGRIAPLPGTFLHCRMENADNETVYEANLPAPDRWLSEAPGDAGEMVRVAPPPDDGDFYLRLPYQPGTHTIEVTRMSPADNGASFLKRSLISLLIDFDGKQGGHHDQ